MLPYTIGTDPKKKRNETFFSFFLAVEELTIIFHLFSLFFFDQVLTIYGYIREASWPAFFRNTCILQYFIRRKMFYLVEGVENYVFPIFSYSLAVQENRLAGGRRILARENPDFDLSLSLPFALPFPHVSPPP